MNLENFWSMPIKILLKKELFFIQKLAEFVNDTQYNIALVTTIHQNFDAYSL